MSFHRLNYERRNGRECYFITHRRTFQQNIFANYENIITEVFEFAYNMTFGHAGEHRDYRAGGQHNRRNGEIFINTFQGKLAEFGFYQYAAELGLKLEIPGLEVWERGRWDMYDFKLNDYHIAVKSTKFYGNLLLLETIDWDAIGNYIPNNIFFNFIFLIRIRPDGEGIMRGNNILYNDVIDRDHLLEIITQENWVFDIAGFITGDELRDEIINAEPPLILPQNSFLQCTTRMDAENYYAQAGDMHPGDNFLNYLRNKNE